MKKIFLTGSEGFIGSHLAEYLISKNYDVTCMVKYNSFSSTGWLAQVKRIEKAKIIFGDVLDQSFIESKTKGFDAIIHLAALIAIPYSYESPENYINTNVIGTYNVLEATRKNKIKKLIHTSTSEVYGTAQQIPINENHPIETQSPYAASKFSADTLVKSYQKSFEIPSITLRPFNVYGPRQSARAFIPNIISQALSDKKFIEVGNLKPKRDYTFVIDTVKAFEKALNKKCYGETINVSNNFDISMLDVCKIILKKINVKKDLKIKKERYRPDKSEVMILNGCNKKAKKLLNWKPKLNKFKGFEVGIEHTVEWFLKNLENYNPYKYNK